MGLGYLKSPRHAAKDRRIVGRLARHAELMVQFEAQGMDREAASQAAMHALLAEENED